jgi:hypothetical protein
MQNAGIKPPAQPRRRQSARARQLGFQRGLVGWCYASMDIVELPDKGRLPERPPTLVVRHDWTLQET